MSHASSVPGIVSDSLVVNPALHMDQLTQEPLHLAGVKLEGHQGRMIVLTTSPVKVEWSTAGSRLFLYMEASYHAITTHNGDILHVLRCVVMA